MILEQGKAPALSGAVLTRAVFAGEQPVRERRPGENADAMFGAEWAVGLMQVTPEAGRDTAKRFSVSYDWNRLVSDPVYNTQSTNSFSIARCASEYSSWIAAIGS
jgi:hypothetical protein